MQQTLLIQLTEKQCSKILGVYVQLCILMAYAYNCYAVHARLFITGGKEIASKEGTTQGDHPSMAYYAIGMTPLIKNCTENDTIGHAKKVAYADDLTGAGKLQEIRKWFHSICEKGAIYGYKAEPTKSWLIVTAVSNPGFAEF